MGKITKVVRIVFGSNDLTDDEDGVVFDEGGSVDGQFKVAVRRRKKVLGLEGVLPKTYDYTYRANDDEDLDIYTHAVVVTAGSIAMQVVRIIEVVDFKDSDWTGEMAPVVALFSNAQYTDELLRNTRIGILIKRAEAHAEKKNKVVKLALLLGDDPDGLAMLDEIRKLQNE